MYGILNPCRVWSYFAEGGFRSKAEAGAWTAERLEPALATLVRRALSMYEGRTAVAGFEPLALRSFAGRIRDLVQEVSTVGAAPERG